ncbi:MAG TPA: alanine racemase [Saccharospirillum sp.]|nr:alanine racemase [Saccharospirillum sp.]
MARNLFADIHLDAICHNYRLAKSMARPGTGCIAIVKADAYGHGAVPVAQALAKQADALGVACIEEAMELRDANISIPILLLEGFFEKSELPELIKHRLWTVIHSFKQLEELEAYAHQSGGLQGLPVWVKVDTGMHRLGFELTDLEPAMTRIQALPSVGPITLMSHFANADCSQDASTRQQIAKLSQLSPGNTARAGIWKNLTFSLSNSAATLAWPTAHYDWLRPGIMLYGANPIGESVMGIRDLKPAMTLSTELIAIRDVPAGEAVGYGSTFHCNQPTRIGTLAIGYADGYSRHARNGTPVFLNGRRAHLAGRVSMDMITIDLTDHQEAKIGDRVELWGENIPVDEVAACCDTIAYTLLSGLTRRVCRRYPS